MFADDLNTSVRSKDPASVTNILQETLHNLSTWTNENGLTFSPSETHFIDFNRKEINNDEPLMRKTSIYQILRTHIVNQRLTRRSHIRNIYIKKRNFKTL